MVFSCIHRSKQNQSTVGFSHRRLQALRQPPDAPRVLAWFCEGTLVWVFKFVFGSSGDRLPSQAMALLPTLFHGRYWIAAAMQAFLKVGVAYWLLAYERICDVMTGLSSFQMRFAVVLGFLSTYLKDQKISWNFVGLHSDTFRGQNSKTNKVYIGISFLFQKGNKLTNQHILTKTYKLEIIRIRTMFWKFCVFSCCFRWSDGAGFVV